MFAQRLRFLIVSMTALALLSGCAAAPTDSGDQDAEAGATSTPPPMLATPVSASPAAGICASTDEPVVTITLGFDAASPRCVRVGPAQRLKVRNETDQARQATIGGLQAELQPGQEFTFEVDFGAYLAPGVHRLVFSGFPGGAEIWLIPDLPPSGDQGAEAGATPTLEPTSPPATPGETLPPTWQAPEILSPPERSEGSAAAPYQTVFSIPVGEGGVQYFGAGVPEMQVSGPNAIAMLPDGSFVVSDLVSNQLLRYDPAGSLVKAINLEWVGIRNILDLVATQAGLYVLDISFSTFPEDTRVSRLSPEGELLGQYSIPPGYRLEDGLWGFAVGGEGQLLLEIAGTPRRFFQIADPLGQFNDRLPAGEVAGIPAFGQVYQVKDAGPGTFPAIVAGKMKVESVPTIGGMLKLLKANPDGSFYVIREDLVTDSPLPRSDQTVHYLTAGGEQLGAARYPLSEGYYPVTRNLAVGPDGNVYALLPRPQAVDILRLNFYPRLEPLVMGAAEPLVGTAAPAP